MDEQLDNDLKNRIRKVFENIGDPSAGEGWLLLRKKFPEEKSRRPVLAWMWWSAAAVLFLFMGIGLWLYNMKDQPQKMAVKTHKHPQTENMAAVKSRQDTIGKNNAAQPFKPNAGTAGSGGNVQSNSQNIAAATKKKAPAPATIAKRLNDAAAKQTFIAKNKGDNKNIATGQQHPVIQQPDKSIIGQQQANRIAANKQPPVKTVTVQPNNQPANVQPGKPATSTLSTNTATSQLVTPSKQPSKSINSMFAEDQNKKKTVDERSKRVIFGLYAATYFNYAKGSNNQANLGAGITSEIKISRNLKLVTGITIAQNSMNFSGGVPTSVAQTSVSQNIYTAPGANTLRAYSLNSAVTVASVPAFKNYDASLVGLDVPVNLKYDFNPKKMDAYVLAGLSSGTFINETYTYQYNYPALASASLQQIQNQTTHQSFNGFYFGRTLNVAVGLGYPVGKNHIVLEPFLKYPLDGLGSQNIRFGAGGINLKFNFQSAKK